MKKGKINMENKYEIIINLNEQTKKVYEKNYNEEGYELIANEDNLIFAKKTYNKNINEEKEKAVTNLALNMVKRCNIKGVLHIDLTNEIHSIIKKIENEENVDFKNNNLSWAIRQAITKAIIKRGEE
jgi:altronate dehydratase